ncbi:hypothetical protein KCU81_g36, partial [Aureobasidium melanogenum]
MCLANFLPQSKPSLLRKAGRRKDLLEPITHTIPHTRDRTTPVQTPQPSLLPQLLCYVPRTVFCAETRKVANPPKAPASQVLEREGVEGAIAEDRGSGAFEELVGLVVLFVLEFTLTMSRGLPIIMPAAPDTYGRDVLVFVSSWFGVLVYSVLQCRMGDGSHDKSGTALEWLLLTATRLTITGFPRRG